MENLNYPLTSLNDKHCLFGDLLHKDRFNLVVFYHTDCLGCTGRALPFGYDLAQQNPKVNFIVVHANFPHRKVTKEEMRGVFTDQHVPFEIYIDDNARLYEAMQCEGTPHWFIMDEKGTIQHSIFGSQEGAKMKIHYALDEQLN